ncbi:MAG TPA: CehA/McbA family metallohydrolase [Thermoanaerobaculia bacterium]|nr:CehA/McbA family metallohydrolase [Thermoanaerobaculia bacterium]
MRRALVLIVSSVVLAIPAAAEEPALRWYKGNTHTHTLNSDGDSTPDEVVRWYREHRYHFLVLTDHNFLTPVDGLNAVHGAEEKFLVIPGEEVTDHFGSKPIHVNGLDLDHHVEPQGGESVADTIQRNVDAIRAADGVPHINHPNFGWAITEDDLRRVRRTKLFEIFNGHPLVNNQGGGGRPGLEQVWDALLTGGMLLYGIAVDDAHHFKRPGDPNASGPGRGWIVVRAAELSVPAILGAIEAGAFYASTGVELERVDSRADALEIAIRSSGDTAFTTTFIGSGGRTLLATGSNPASYRIRGDEGYVRAKVVDSNGRAAWVQPVLVPSRAVQAPPVAGDPAD